MALQESFSDIGIPDRQGDRDKLAATPAAGNAVATSRAAPHPASHRPRTSRDFTTMPPSISCEASATAKSCGVARGADVNPKAVSDKNDRGVETASRSSRYPGCNSGATISSASSSAYAGWDQCRSRVRTSVTLGPAALGPFGWVGAGGTSRGGRVSGPGLRRLTR